MAVTLIKNSPSKEGEFFKDIDLLAIWKTIKMG
jgi:hypothetical protein